MIDEKNPWFQDLMDMSSNFTANNFEELVSLAVLVLKFYVLNKVIIKRVLRRFGFLGF